MIIIINIIIMIITIIYSSYLIFYFQSYIYFIGITTTGRESES
jgi:hypothetical protein